MRLLIGVCFLMLSTLAHCQETCQSADEDPYLLFGTKTAYTFANKGIPVSRVHDVPGCQPMAIWLLTRHGSHNPEANEIEKLQKLTDLRNNIIANYKNGNYRNTNIRMCTSDVNLLERWEWNPRLNTTFAGDLTSDGYITTQQLAQAWKQRFPGLLTDNTHDYLFKYVDDRRSGTTFRAFTEGLFRSQADSYDIPKENDEKLLTPYKFCPAWTRQVEENNETLSQLRIFESKQEFKQMLSNISLRMGFNYDVQREVVMSALDMCRYNKAWDVTQISPWCAIFSKDDLKRFEYAEDLETYYKYGYGSPANRQIGCTGVKDMMDFFKIHVESESPRQPRARVLVSSAAALLLGVSSLEGRRDHAPLTGDNYHGAAAARRWTSSDIAPYNANLAAVLYKCTPNGNFQITDQYQVLFLENERPLYLEGCRVGLCSWSSIKTRFGPVADRCDLDFCNSAAKLNGAIWLGLGLFAFLTKVVF